MIAGQEQQEMKPMGVPVAVVQAGPQQWSTGLCDCGEDCMGCCEAYWCQCCALGYQASFIMSRSTSCDCGTCCAACFCGPFYYIGYLRGTVTGRYNLVFDHGCCATSCCPCLVIAQNRREMRRRGDMVGGCCS